MRLAALGRIALIVVALILASSTAPPAEARTPTRVERALLGAVNQARRAHGVRPVRLAWPLQRRAHVYARYMMRTDRWAHSWALPRGVRENLAVGPVRGTTPREIVGWWLNSRSHRAALLWSGARRAGIGASRGVFWGYWPMQVSVARFAP